LIVGLNFQPEITEIYTIPASWLPYRSLPVLLSS
jgi:hypothetical protein